jgi:hypothetical protein
MQNFQDISSGYQSGDRGLAKSTLLGVGEVAGAAKDVAGDTVKGVSKYIPDFISKPVSDLVKKRVNSIVPESVQKALGGYAKEWAKNNPEDAKTAGAVGNIASLYPVGNAAEDVAGLANASKGIVTRPLGGIREAINAKSDAMATASRKPNVTSEALRKEAHLAYEFSNTKGGIYKPVVTDNFINSAQGLAKQTPKGKLLFGDTPSEQLIAKLEQFRGSPMTLREAEEMDQGFGELARDHIDKKTGKFDAQGQKYYALQQKLRSFVTNPKDEDILGGREGIDASKRGRELWAQSARLRDIEDIIERANLTDNPISSSKTGFKNLYMNKARLAGFTDEEKALIKQAAKSGATVNLARMFGSRLVPIAATVSGGGLGADLISGTVAHGISSGARGLANRLYSARPQRVLDAVTSRNITPMPSSIGTQFDDFLKQ